MLDEMLEKLLEQKNVSEWLVSFQVMTGTVHGMLHKWYPCGDTEQYFPAARLLENYRAQVQL